MKNYISHKKVQAEPMHYYEALKLKLINTDNEEPSEKDGYKVVYDTGYTSWSPATAFDKGYKELPESIVDKLQAEHDDLIDMTKRLELFIANGATTHDEYNKVLIEQAEHMNKYILSLSKRIYILSTGEEVNLNYSPTINHMSCGS